MEFNYGLFILLLFILLWFLFRKFIEFETVETKNKIIKKVIFVPPNICNILIIIAIIVVIFRLCMQ